MTGYGAEQHSSPAWRWLLWGSIPLLLLVPAVAMLLTDEVRWGPEDFVAAAMLFGLTAALVDTVLRFARSPLLRLVLVGVVLMVLVLVWMELAVGVLGSPLAGN